ncbi:MAG: alpha-amylase family glycosyl hydrolase [Bacteroidota bacterium]
MKFKNLLTFFAIIIYLKLSILTINAQLQKTPFIWDNATVYFLLTDRFNNGDNHNDTNFDRTKNTGTLRGFEGGDIKGVTKKIKEGYFQKLGVNAIWITPVVEQIHESVDEGTGNTYGFHGYWAKDWTALDPNFGSTQDLANLVEVAHQNGIRILLDGVINHTGPVTEQDPVWPEDWVRTEPKCTYRSYETFISCTLVENLPDIKTESLKEVEIPAQLAEKWKSEGRYDQEMKELDDFFKRTGYPKTPYYYIIKWLTDYITEFGIDGYRADTVKHIEEFVWADFKTECDYAFAVWKQNNPTKRLDDNAFFLVGEVYGYGISSGKIYDFGDKKVDYFKNGFNSLINFEFKYDAQKDYEFIFSKYNDKLKDKMDDFGILNYLSSHDDGAPFDKQREKSYESALKLLLSQGSAQIYYGDESARTLNVKGTVGDATLRSFMNWNEIETNNDTKEILLHWQKIGQFRNDHPSIGAGIHKMISKSPYIFSRTYTKGNYNDKVVVGIDLPKRKKVINVSSIFNNKTILIDTYSGKKVKVKKGKVKLKTNFNIVLLEQKKK